jgi:hypothetical protein
MISEAAKAAGLEIHDEGFKALWYPDGEAIAQAVEYGRMFARAF